MLPRSAPCASSSARARASASLLPTTRSMPPAWLMAVPASSSGEGRAAVRRARPLAAKTGTTWLGLGLGLGLGQGLGLELGLGLG